MPLITDQSGRSVDIPSFPQRIISLVPSQTELLYHLGLEERVTGITKFCVHPEQWFRSKTRIGGTKSVKHEVIKQLQPDLVLANKEENMRDQVEELARHYPVWVSDIHNLDTALDMIIQVGLITGKLMMAEAIERDIHHNFQLFSQQATLHSPLNTCYLIWRNPWMTIGGDTFIHDMLSRCGFQNIFGDHNRYPEVTIDTLRNKNCQLLLLSSEPYPFKENHIAELQQELPDTKIMLVDGEMFSWYGSRLLKAPDYFSELLKQLQA